MGDTLQIPDSPEFVRALLPHEEMSDSDSEEVPAPVSRRRVTPVLVECAEIGMAFVKAGFAPWPHNLPDPLARTAFMNWMFAHLYRYPILIE